MLNILLVVYGDTYLDESVEKLIDISGHLFPGEKYRIVVADTAKTASLEVKNCHSYTYIMPGNVSREFTGWKGCLEHVKNNYILTDDDIFIVANDTFYRSYGDKYLENFLHVDVNRVKQEKQIIGYVDCYPSEVRFAGSTFKCWVRTSFFITGYNVLKENNIFDPPFKKEDVFDGLDFFKENNVLSEYYKRYIKSWLFSDEEAPEDFPYKWHSAKSKQESCIADIVDKACCILNEHSITWSLRSKGVSVIRANPVQYHSDLDSLPLKLKIQVLFYLGRDNHEITNKSIREYLFKEAYWDGANICPTKVKIVWLSQQSWYLEIFQHKNDSLGFRTADIFFEIRKDLQKVHRLDNDYTYKKYLYEIYLGDCNNEYYPDKYEIGWLNSEAFEECNLDLGGMNLPWVFWLIYEYEFKIAYNDSPTPEIYFPAYLFFTSKRWANKAGMEVFYDWVVNDRDKLVESIIQYVKSYYNIDLTRLTDIETVYSDELYIKRIDTTLLSLLVEDPGRDISTLNDEEEISIFLNLRYLQRNSKGESGLTYIINNNKGVLEAGGKSLLQRLYYPLMLEYLESVKFNYDALFNDNDNSIIEKQVCKPEQKNDSLSVVGFARSELGTGEDTRRTHNMLASLGFDVSIYPLFPGSKIYKNKHDELSSYENTELGNVQIYTMSPAEFMLTYMRNNDISTARGYKIGYFAWEFSTWKDEFNIIYDLLDEIWVISKFLLPAFENSKIPVKYIPPIVELISERPSDDEILKRLGVPKETYLFLSIFDIKSTVARKNPMALIDAFLTEYSDNCSVKLILKFSYDDFDKESNPELFDQIKRSSNIIHISEMLSKAELDALISACDALVSLHRSEGFGRVIAEAMLLRTLVICTNYSGNLDFCGEQNAILVDYDLVPVSDKDYPFASGLQWAEVRKESVINSLRQAVGDRHGNQLRIENAYHYIKAHHSISSVRFIAKEEITNAISRSRSKVLNSSVGAD